MGCRHRLVRVDPDSHVGGFGVLMDRHEVVELLHWFTSVRNMPLRGRTTWHSTGEVFHHRCCMSCHCRARVRHHRSSLPRKTPFLRRQRICSTVVFGNNSMKHKVILPGRLAGCSSGGVQATGDECALLKIFVQLHFSVLTPMLAQYSSMLALTYNT